MCYGAVVMVTFFGIYLGYKVGNYSSTQRILHILSRSRNNNLISPEHESLHKQIIAREKSLYEDNMEYALIHSGQASRGLSANRIASFSASEEITPEAHIFASDRYD